MPTKWFQELANHLVHFNGQQHKRLHTFSTLTERTRWTVLRPAVQGFPATIKLWLGLGVHCSATARALAMRGALPRKHKNQKPTKRNLTFKSQWGTPHLRQGIPSTLRSFCLHERARGACCAGQKTGCWVLAVRVVETAGASAAGGCCKLPLRVDTGCAPKLAKPVAEKRWKKQPKLFGAQDQEGHSIRTGVRTFCTQKLNLL